jgi:hypothetical protein
MDRMMAIFGNWLASVGSPVGHCKPETVSGLKLLGVKFHCRNWRPFSSTSVDAAKRVVTGDKQIKSFWRFVFK